MNAVNLIPAESRRSEAPSLPGLPFLGLIAALALALVGTVVYVHARNGVAAQHSELTQINAGTAEWSADAARYGSAVGAVRHRAKGFEALGALLGEQADWSLLLNQLAGVMPAQAELTSMAAASGAAASSGASSASAAGPGITIAGCAASQPLVADTIVGLRRVTGVDYVSLQSASLGGSSGGSSGSASAAGCAKPLPVQYSILIEFSPTASAMQLLKAVGLGRYLQTSASTQSASGTTKTTTGAAS